MPLFIFAASCTKHPSSEDLYAHARSTLEHGHLSVAQNEAHAGYERFRASNPEWAWRFRLLEADALSLRGFGHDVITLLDSELPPSLAHTDLAIRQQMFLGFAHALLGGFAEADARVRKAEELCSVSHCAMDGEVARIHGVVEILRGDFPQAENFFRTTLQVARARGDHFLEATALLNLGVGAMQQERYDQSIDWSNAAARLSKGLDARLIAEKSLGNLAWCFYTMGDFNKAIQMNAEAEEKARGLDVETDQVHWLNNAGPVDPRKIAARAAGVVLFYSLGRQESYVWGTSSSRTIFAKLPPAAEIEAAVERYRNALIEGRDILQTTDADATNLYQILVSPIQALLRPNERVVVIPDGSLNNLNFETLVVPGHVPHFWLEDVSVTNAGSLRLLAAATSTKSHNERLLLIGDPISPGIEYPELRSATLEISNIEKHFPDSQRQVYTRQGATPSAYLQSRPEQFAYVHFVAHGTASLESPLESSVVLSKTTTDEDSFKLHARDIMRYRLRADLVTISTCYGSGTAIYTGEGLVGLSWAFLRAGAHNVIGALWEVSDSSTPQLMDQLYSELKKGSDPQVALRTAKLALLHSDGIFHKPYYWAPFQLYTGS